LNGFKKVALAGLVITLGLAGCQDTGGGSQQPLDSIGDASEPALMSDEMSMGAEPSAEASESP